MSNINELFHQRTMRDSILENPICKMCNLEVETAKQILTLNTSKWDNIQRNYTNLTEYIDIYIYI